MKSGPYAKFWAAHAAGKIKDLNLSTCMDPAVRFNMGMRAHLRQQMARNYKDKVKEVVLVKPVEVAQ